MDMLGVSVGITFRFRRRSGRVIEGLFCAG